VATRKKKTTVKKKTTRKPVAKKTTSPKAASKKKLVQKKVTRKTTSKKSPRKQVSRATSKKSSVKKTTKVKPKKTAPAKNKQSKVAVSSKTIKQIEAEQEKMGAIINEIRSLELDNKRLENQIAKAQTKQEILAELKTYLSLLKQSPQQVPVTKASFDEADKKTTELQRTLEQNKNELHKEIEKVQTKDKLISRLKNLLAVRTTDEEKASQEVRELEFHPTKEQQQRADNAYKAAVQQETSQQPTITRPLPPPPKSEAKEDNESSIEIEESTVKQIQNIINEHEDEADVETEHKSTMRKSDFQTQKVRGILTPEEAKEYALLLKKATKEVNRVFLGQEDVVERVLISVICDAHTLLEGVPGLAKTLLVETLAKIIDGTTFKRIQFLPDLLPSDIIGGQIFNPKTAEYKIYKGPIFANFVLCDEINRAPPKTHAAVMEAMQEKKINIENEEFILDKPFFVLATQNPLENKGTYDLPEAVLDRFMFKVMLDYPRREIEYDIITENATTKNLKKGVKKVIQKETLLEMQKKVKTVYLADKIRDYILDLVEATRGVNKNIQGYKFVKYGAGVRASIYLSLAAKAKAVMEGRNYVLPDDVDFIAPDVMRHRIALNYRGKAHNITSDKIVDEILLKVKAV